MEMHYNFCSPDLKRNKEVVMTAVKKYGSSLQYADVSLQASDDIVMAAVKSFGEALEFASPRLKGDRHIVLEAIKSNPESFVYISPSLKTREFYLDLISERPDVLYMIRIDDPGIIDDLDFVLKALDRNSKAFFYISHRLKNDPLVLAYAKYSDHPKKLTPEQMQ